MNLKSGYPFWAIRNGLSNSFPAPERDIKCDVAIMGGGISGALIAHEFSSHGFDVAVLERRDPGWGSSAASTAMLQYEIDTHMLDLAEQYGEKNAALAYTSCAEAIPRLGEVVRYAGGAEFARCDSLYYASDRRVLKTLNEETASRIRHGLPARYIESGEIRERYGFDAPGAILSKLGARVDPYLFTINLLERLQKAGVQVYDRACVVAMKHNARGVDLSLASGAHVRASHLIIAAGYETQQWLPQKVASNRSSYAYVSDPMPAERLGNFSKLLVWETARPYLYLRATSDHRLVVGGLDDTVDIPVRRDARTTSKSQQLRKRLVDLRPDLVAEIAFGWAGTFAETDDGLPFFGPHPATGSRVLYAMAYGGNGITYSMAGAPLLRAWVERRAHPLRKLYGFERLGSKLKT